jgi:hypothetical protein
MKTTRISLVAIASAILTATLASWPARAQSEREAPPVGEAAAAAAPAPADEAAKPAEPVPPPAAPKCECPPPCPPPPPPPPPPSADAAEWKVQSKGGMLITGGNSQSKNFTFGVNGSRKQGNNKLAIEGGFAYGTSNNSVAHASPVTNADGSTSYVIDEVHREEVVSTNSWAAKGRYDRFLTENNTAFAAGLIAGNRIAGKTLMGGGQVGYSRQLWKDQWNLVVAEIGYDFSYERYVQQPGKTIDPVSIHSARVLVGETLSLTKETGVTASVEALFNVNKEGKAINASDGTTGVDPFKDTRVNGKLALTTVLFKDLSFGFSFACKYDQNPAPRPVPPSNVAGAKWPDAYWSLAYTQKWDTITEATLIYTFF